MNPPAALKFPRTNAWKQYKVFRAAYGRHSNFATRALVEFNEINYRWRHFVTSSRANYEQSLIDGYSDAPNLFHSYICKKKIGRLAVGPLTRPSEQVIDNPREMAELFADTLASALLGMFLWIQLLAGSLME